MPTIPQYFSKKSISAPSIPSQTGAVRVGTALSNLGDAAINSVKTLMAIQKVKRNADDAVTVANASLALQTFLADQLSSVLSSDLPPSKMPIAFLEAATKRLKETSDSLDVLPEAKAEFVSDGARLISATYSRLVPQTTQLGRQRAEAALETDINQAVVDDLLSPDGSLSPLGAEVIARINARIDSSPHFSPEEKEQLRRKSLAAIGKQAIIRQAETSQAPVHDYLESKYAKIFGLTPEDVLSIKQSLLKAEEAKMQTMRQAREMAIISYEEELIDAIVQNDRARIASLEDEAKRNPVLYDSYRRISTNRGLLPDEYNSIVFSIASGKKTLGQARAEGLLNDASAEQIAKLAQLQRAVAADKIKNYASIVESVVGVGVPLERYMAEILERANSMATERNISLSDAFKEIFVNQQQDYVSKMNIEERIIRAELQGDPSRSNVWFKEIVDPDTKEQQAVLLKRLIEIQKIKRKIEELQAFMEKQQQKKTPPALLP